MTNLRLIALLPALMLAILGGQIAHAQETGTLIKRKVAQIKGSGPDAARAALEDFATCVVDRSPTRAARISEVPVGTAEYSQILSSLSDFYDTCLSTGELTSNSMIFRGAVFQALYKREFKSAETLDFAGIETGHRAIYPETIGDEARNILALANFGECVTRADAANVRTLVRAIPGSAVERDGFAVLSGHYSGCIPQGEQISFSRSVLKGALAEGLYRLSIAARAGGKAQ